MDNKNSLSVRYKLSFVENFDRNLPWFFPVVNVLNHLKGYGRENRKKVRL